MSDTKEEIKATIEETIESIKTSLKVHGSDARLEILKSVDAEIHKRITELDPSYDPSQPVPTPYQST